ncbi:alpha/beta hydrolase [Gemelliphila palaticanis]|uniref:Alpha/beta hydrolase n=1 Tax=Gemelliphila palaticanis TaxID=81950 RepID=A0ABX2SZB9_9BACL|nr:alpha/beta hydrolase-fold protein [Gemella palaticanis]MBF0714778.1 alpha/beta hydrolase [Gemella palaticanis]NYS46708.1 alpha/beta hydrolase [Gemella palaticanis]
MKTNFNKYYLEMHTHFLEVPYYEEKRRIRVLLPKDYDKEQWATYPIIYMHDGQNVFYSKEAFSGHSWKLIPTIKNNKQLPKMIVVGIDNAGENRLNEYAPWLTDTSKNSFFANFGGDGMKYGEWLVNTVKPFIDEKYRTKKDKQNTILAGSSMGGIITAYIGSKYPNIFGVLGVFSLASWFSERDFIRFIEHHKLDEDTKVYIQVGTKEGDDTDAEFIDNMNQAYIDCSLNYYNTLIETGKSTKNMWLRILANETHHEKYWANHFLEFLKFSFSN